ELQRIRLKYATLETMAEGSPWKMDAALDYATNADAILIFSAANPDLFSGLDAEKLRTKQQPEAVQSHRLFEPLSVGAANWLVAGAAGTSWASKVFPELPLDEAKLKLWDTIFEVCRVKFTDPVSAWEFHIAGLAKRMTYLNAKKYTAFKYTGPGTELT